MRYVTRDYAITIVDGYFLLRYWSLNYSTKMSDHKTCRALCQINGLTCQVFNNTGAYEQLRAFLREFYDDQVEHASVGQLSRSTSVSSVTPRPPLNPLNSLIHQLLPVIKIQIAFSRFIVGNIILPSSFVAYIRRASLYYAVEPIEGKQNEAIHDLAVHVLKGKVYKLRVCSIRTTLYQYSLFV